MFFFQARHAIADLDTSILLVGGMETSECLRRVDAALRAVKGVDSAGVNLLTRLAAVRHDKSVRVEALISAVNKAGFCAQRTARQTAEDATAPAVAEARGARARFGACAIMTALLIVVTSSRAAASWKLPLCLLLATPVQFALGGRYLYGALSAFRSRGCTLRSLGALCACSAYVQGVLCLIGETTTDPELITWAPQFHAGALLVTLIALGDWLDVLADDSSETVCQTLERLLPRDACVLRDGKEVRISADSVRPGEIVLVGPNERIPVDGEILEGYSHVVEDSLYRKPEQRPASKVRGDRVMAATLNGSGCLRLRATGIGAHSTLAHISLLVSRARSKRVRSPVQDLRLARWLAFAIFFAALFTFSFWRFGPGLLSSLRQLHFIPQGLLADLKTSPLRFLFEQPSLLRCVHATLTMLTAAFPAALALSAPAGALAAARAFVRRGILLRDGDALERAERITDVAFLSDDILVCGLRRVREILTAPGMERDAVLGLAASVSARSGSKSLRSIEREARTRGVPVPISEDSEKLGSEAQRARIGALDFWLCPPEFLAANGLAFKPGDKRGESASGLFARVQAAQEQGCEVLTLCRAGGEVLGAVVLEERVKDEARAAISALRSAGMKLHLLSAAPLPQARALARACGLGESEVHTLAHTESKAEFIAQITAMGRRIAAVGMHGSDAPALSAAEVGIALGVENAAASDAASVVLLSADIGGIPDVFTRTRLSAHIMRQNRWLALVPLAAAMPLIFTGHTSAFVGVCLGASALLPIALNCLRLSVEKKMESGARGAAKLSFLDVKAGVKAA